jgi:hypothetical protein
MPNDFEPRVETINSKGQWSFEVELAQSRENPLAVTGYKGLTYPADRTEVA